MIRQQPYCPNSGCSPRGNQERVKDMAVELEAVSLFIQLITTIFTIALVDSLLEDFYPIFFVGLLEVNYYYLFSFDLSVSLVTFQ